MLRLPFCRCLVLLCLVLMQCVVGHSVEFEKKVLTDKYYCDGVASGDINGDGQLDVVAGPFWYEGPDFETAHAFYEPKPLPPEPNPSNSMFSFLHDLNDDGHLDILVLGRVHKHEAKWYENPGPSSLGTHWESHFVFERVTGESPTLIDLDSNGIPQVICHSEGRWGWIEPNPTSPYEPWTFTAIGDNEDWPQFYHGEGVGDINGDGKLDLIINDGWYEQPNSKPSKKPQTKPDAELTNWRFHRSRFSQERGGAQMFAFDVDGDGDNDVVSAKHAHEWGLAWYEQQPVGKSARFREHTIMGTRVEIEQYGIAFTQPHAITVADMDGDGLLDIITGKRRWAHGPEGDIEPSAEPVVVCFLLRRSDGKVNFEPTVVDRSSGVGVQIATNDLNGDGKQDILTASKLGTFVFLSR